MHLLHLPLGIQRPPLSACFIVEPFLRADAPLQVQRCTNTGSRSAQTALPEHSLSPWMASDLQLFNDSVSGPLDEMDNLLGQVTELLSSVSEMLCDEHQ